MSQHENDIQQLKRQLEVMRHAHQEEILHLREQHRYELERLNKERDSERRDHTYRLQDLRQQHQCELEEQKKIEDEKLRRSEELYRMQIKGYEAEVSELRKQLYYK